MRSCDAVVLIAGASGTLNEFTIAYDESKLIGVLTKTGGVADHIKNLVENVLRKKKSSGTVIYNEDPKELVRELVERIQQL